MKKGTPKRVVIIPMGISAGGTIILAKMSEKTRSIPPRYADRGIRIECFPLPVFFAIWGIISPMKPIGPVYDTIIAMMMERARKTMILNFSTSTPLLNAISSDKEKRSSSLL